MTTATRPSPRTRTRLTRPRTADGVLLPALFAIPLGIAALALCWSVAHTLLGAPGWPALGLWLVAATTWAVLTFAYGGQVVRGRRLLAELTDPTFGPFTAWPGVITMLLGGALADYARTTVQVVFAVGFVLTSAIGGFLSGQWIVGDLQLAQWHPGYFVPTVAGGLVAAATAAGLGFPRLAQPATPGLR